VEKNNIIIEMVQDWPKEQIVELYKSGGWWQDDYESDGLDSLIKGSFAFAIAVDATTGNAVGMGRAISDGVSDAWLQDIVVLDDYRKRGIGRAIIEKLLQFCQEKKLGWIGLVAEPGTKEFYMPLGFDILPGEPMVFKKKEF